MHDRIPRPLRRLGTLATIAMLPILATLPACGRSDTGSGGEPASAAMPTMPAGEAVTVSLSVEGMHCGGCANAIRERVAKIDGVSACEVSFEKGEATVTMHHPASPDGVTQAIARLGYTVKAIPGGEPEATPEAAAGSDAAG